MCHGTLLVDRRTGGSCLVTGDCRLISCGAAWSICTSITSPRFVVGCLELRASANLIENWHYIDSILNL